MNEQNASPILSHGDALSEGVYKLHSSFDSALNYFDGESLLSLVTVDVGPGPANIVMERPLPRDLRSVTLKTGSLRLDARVAPLPQDRRYRSALERAPVKRWVLERNMGFLLASLARIAPAGSLSFLVSAPVGSSTVERQLSLRMRRAADRLFDGELIAGVELARGAGPGLSPAGDDFLCGVLAALDVIELVSGRDLAGRKDVIHQHALGRNPLSNAFLGFARRGLYDERFKRFLTALVSGDEIAVDRLARPLMSFGATSGADWATGVATALKRWRTLWS